MGIVDTHAHYQDAAFQEDRDQLINNLFKNNVDLILTAGTTVQSSIDCISLAEKYQNIYAAVGIHPSDLLEDIYIQQYSQNKVIDKIIELYNHPKSVAIGEIGLEYHYDFVPKDLQINWFEQQIQLSKSLDAPIIVHDREAHEDTINLLKKYKPKGVVHCFSGSVEMLKEILKLDMYIGIGGAVTFKNARKPIEAIEYVPLDRLLLETDCPYMAPEPYRGQRCDSSMIDKIAEKIASIRNMEKEEILNITKENAFSAFPKLKKGSS